MIKGHLYNITQDKRRKLLQSNNKSSHNKNQQGFQTILSSIQSVERSHCLAMANSRVFTSRPTFSKRWDGRWIKGNAHQPKLATMSFFHMTNKSKIIMQVMYVKILAKVKVTVRKASKHWPVPNLAQILPQWAKVCYKVSIQARQIWQLLLKRCKMR